MRERAFTFIEMVLTLTLIAVLFAFALPAWRNFLFSSHEKVFQQQLLRAIQFAQQESHARYTQIGVCQSNDRLHCEGEWLDGQLVFVDANENKSINDKTQILFVLQSPLHEGMLHWREYPYYRDYLQFSARGLNGDNGTFWYCRAPNANPRWALVLSKSGITHIEYPDKKGVLRDGKGVVLAC